MSLGYKADAIAEKGGEYGFALQQVNADGTDYSGSPAWFLLGYLQDVTPRFEIKEKEIYDDTGALVKVVKQQIQVGYDATLLQSDADILNFLAEDSVNAFYRAYRDHGIVNGNHQEFFDAIVQVQNKYAVKTGDKVIPIVIRTLKNQNAVTIAALDLPTNCHTSSDVTIPATKFRKLVETAVS